MAATWRIYPILGATINRIVAEVQTEMGKATDQQLRSFTCIGKRGELGDREME